MTATIYALDFDGVICDSALETGLSAWRAARQIWPTLPLQIPKDVLSGFRRVRPALETGFEAILINRCLFDGSSADALLADISRHLDAIRQQYQLRDDDLKNLFGTVRDQWITEDFANWIANNPLYPGMIAFLQQIPPAQLFIITTKQQRFVEAILKASGVALPPVQIYGLERQRSKSDILGEFVGRFPAKICFVEDRLPTLLDIIRAPHLNRVDLWLADWGYNTPDDQQFAARSSRIKMLALQDLQRLL